jgi:hypothetical protein
MAFSNFLFGWVGKAYPRGEVLNGTQLVSVVALFANFKVWNCHFWPSLLFGGKAYVMLEERSQKALTSCQPLPNLQILEP